MRCWSSGRESYMKTITLSDDGFDSLLLMLGYAAGSANKDGNTALFCTFVRLANEVNKDNPRWTPYEVPDKP